MKWSVLVGLGFAIAALGAIVLAVGLLIGYPVYGVAILALGAAVSLIGGAKRFLDAG
jgi:hypothetical protein